MSSSQTQTGKRQTKRKKISEAPRTAIGHVLHGNLFNSDFFARHKLAIFAIITLTMFYIITKYQCMTGVETIRKLETQLEIVKTERIRERSTYMSRIRESSMAELADSIHPGLSTHVSPPYEIKY